MGIQIGPAKRLLNRRTRSLLPMSVADEDMTFTKLHLRQQQQARYYMCSSFLGEDDHLHSSCPGVGVGSKVAD